MKCIRLNFNWRPVSTDVCSDGYLVDTYEVGMHNVNEIKEVTTEGSVVSPEYHVRFNNGDLVVVNNPNLAFYKHPENNALVAHPIG